MSDWPAWLSVPAAVAQDASATMQFSQTGGVQVTHIMQLLCFRLVSMVCFLSLPRRLQSRGSLVLDTLSVPFVLTPSPWSLLFGFPLISLGSSESTLSLSSPPASNGYQAPLHTSLSAFLVRLFRPFT